MTALELQLLRVPDCEEAIERAYFEWGRGWAVDSPEPAWDLASPEERHHISLRGYELYDGWPGQTGNQIGALDAYITVGINSRIVLNDVVRFLIRADQANPLLAKIPVDARLEDGTNGQIAAAAQLIDLFVGASRIGRGKATKLLYKKRPAFIPILDSVVADFLWKNFPHFLTGGSPIDDVLHLYRELLLVQAEQLQHIQAALVGDGFILSTARVLDFLIWSGWYGHVDQLGFGRPITTEWETRSVPEARTKARLSWEQQTSTTALQTDQACSNSKTTESAPSVRRLGRFLAARVSRKPELPLSVYRSRPKRGDTHAGRRARALWLSPASVLR